MTSGEGLAELERKRLGFTSDEGSRLQGEVSHVGHLAAPFRGHMGS